MKLDRQQSAITGAALIGLGLVWWLNLWWLLWPSLIAAVGVIVYQQRRSVGRVVEAVQAALWGVGLGVLFLINFVWPGILFLAGLTLILRGREDRADAQIQQFLSRLPAHRPVSRPATTQHVPIATGQAVDAAPVVHRSEHSATGETTRL